MPLSVSELLAPKLTSAQKAIKDVLDTCKKGDLLTVPELCAAARCGRDALWRACRLDIFAGCQVLYRKALYFGKPATIADFKKQLGV